MFFLIKHMEYTKFSSSKIVLKDKIIAFSRLGIKASSEANRKGVGNVPHAMFLVTRVNAYTECEYNYFNAWGMFLPSRLIEGELRSGSPISNV